MNGNEHRRAQSRLQVMKTPDTVTITALQLLKTGSPTAVFTGLRPQAYKGFFIWSWEAPSKVTDLRYLSGSVRPRILPVLSFWQTLARSRSHRWSSRVSEVPLLRVHLNAAVLLALPSWGRQTAGPRGSAPLCELRGG